MRTAAASGGDVNPGNTRTTRPASATHKPAHSATCGLSPEPSAAASIVNCTLPNMMSAPVPALRLAYAKENGTAYTASRPADVQEPVAGTTFLRLQAVTSSSVTAPDTRRMVEKVAASTAASRSAMRHRTEFAAKATSAIVVNAVLGMCDCHRPWHGVPNSI